ncbi:50S ribosomal protein L29 [Candidatus Woesearchaeota archaeon]|nr:50S ribosomal protein L29 [Candidatus Woesearchaeota archaeon]
MKTTKDLKSLPQDGLKEKLGEFKKELLKLNVQVATGANASSPGKLKQTKKNIARILTLLNQRRSEQQ